MEEVAKDIYRIGVPLPGNPLKEINSYFIRGTDSDLLIDTGFRRQECREALLAGLEELGWRRDRLDVLLTHMHSDHSGMAAEIAGSNRRVYMSAVDLNLLGSVLSGENRRAMYERFVSEGFPADMADRIQSTNPARKAAVEAVDSRFTPLSGGQRLQVGGYSIKAVQTPGHTPGNQMYWMEREGIMFTGDNILFDISPNITAFAGVEDSLGDYLNSLRRADEFPVKLALPGHRKSGDYHQRIHDLLEHHSTRIAEALRVVETLPGSTAYEITGHMTWRIHAKDWDSFPETQRWYAVGECLSHLDHARLAGQIVRERVGDVWHYWAISNAK